MVVAQARGPLFQLEVLVGQREHGELILHDDVEGRDTRPQLVEASRSGAALRHGAARYVTRTWITRAPRRPVVRHTHGVVAAITRALLALESSGSFAARLRVPAETLRLSITKVGAVEFPLTSATVTRLLAVASRSPFGRREQTVLDPSVRSGWELAKSRLKIDARRWNPALRGILDSLAEQLGLGDPGRLTATLDKLTIYGPGEFFKAHQDTLVVLLPSKFSGGTLRVDRQGKQIEFRRTAKAATQLEILAFYADCHHEIRPVTSGHRVALVYRLCAAMPAAAREFQLAPEQIESLVHAIASHFATPQSVRYPRAGPTTFVPEKLIYLLDHQYTPQGLAWSKLKGADAVRAAALREVATALDLDIHLALADVHEVWSCESSSTRRSSRWQDDDDDADDYDESDDDHEPIELIDSDIALRHWQSLSGKPVKFGTLPIGDAELCFTTANDALHPFASEYEGYMGNYGETLDRWYHRAAVVLWPQANS
jgi:hypothetical protein